MFFYFWGIIVTRHLADANVTTAKVADANITYAKLLSTIFSGQVASFTNPGSGAGTFYYVNIGGIKVLYGIFAAVATGSDATLTIPSFFTTIRTIVATPGPVASTDTVYAEVISYSTTSVVIRLKAVSGSGTMPVNVIVVGS